MKKSSSKTPMMGWRAESAMGSPTPEAVAPTL